MPIYVYRDSTGEKSMNGVWNAEVYILYLAYLGEAGSEFLSEHLSEVEVTARNYCCTR